MKFSDPKVTHSVLLVDGMPLAYANQAKIGHLANSAGEPTGMIFGFLRSVNAYAKRYKCDKVVVAWDLSGTPIKAQGFVGYKSGRALTVDKMVARIQLSRLREIIGQTWWSQVDAFGFEADDVLGTLARRFEINSLVDSIRIVTSDHDLLQLVTNRITWVDAREKDLKRQEWNVERVFAEYGVKPEQLCLYRAVEGDKSDHIPGLGWTKPRLFDLKVRLLACGGQVEPDMKRSLWNDEEWITVKRNFDLMTLYEPAKLNVTKGIGSDSALLEAFNQLESKLLVKDLLAYVRPYWSKLKLTE